MQTIIPIFGLATMVGLGYLLSNNKKEISWRPVLGGVLAQVTFGYLVLKTTIGRLIFESANNAFNSLLSYAQEGTKFVFGPLGTQEHLGFIFATNVLPIIIFFSALMAVLYHFGIMNKIITVLAKVMMKILGTSGAETLAAVSNIFAGQSEATIIVLPFIGRMTRSEIMALMTGGMATVSGSVMVAYVSLGMEPGHLLTASVMSAPAALVIAKLMVPETGTPVTSGQVELEYKDNATNVIEAAVNGTMDGFKLAVAVAAMLVSFIALVALMNGILGWFGGLVGFENLSMELILGYLFSPFAFLMGIPLDECLQVGNLLGKKMVLNEFIAYLDLQKIAGQIEPRSKIIATYALCGFANFGSIAIQIGGIGALVPERKKDLAEIGFKSMIGGSIACVMTACIASIFI